MNAIRKNKHKQYQAKKDRFVFRKSSIKLAHILMLFLNAFLEPAIYYENVFTSQSQAQKYR